jgi:hypothetical protein
MSTIGGVAATVVRALEAQGIEGKRLAAEAGIDPASLLDAEARVPRWR